MFLLILRKLWLRRPRSDAETTSLPSNSASGRPILEIEDKAQMPDITFTTTASCDESETTVNELALQAATASHTSSIAQHEPAILAKPETKQTAPDRATQQPEREEDEEEGEEEEETFYHLSSLITISCLPPSQSQTSVSTVTSKSARRKSLAFDTKRASSILNLNIGDLPSLPFPIPNHGITGKPGPRYSPLPPPFVQKTLAMRPEVRF
jgi:hypothetical protein